MQPSRLAADPKAGLVHVLDRRRGDVIPHHICEALKAPAKARLIRAMVAAASVTPGRPSTRPDASRQQRVVEEIEYKRTDPGPYCMGALTPSGNGAAFARRNRAAAIVHDAR